MESSVKLPQVGELWELPGGSTYEIICIARDRVSADYKHWVVVNPVGANSGWSVVLVFELNYFIHEHEWLKDKR